MLKAGDELSFDIIADEISAHAFGTRPSIAAGIDPEVMHDMLGELLKGPASAR